MNCCEYGHSEGGGVLREVACRGVSGVVMVVGLAVLTAMSGKPDRAEHRQILAGLVDSSGRTDGVFRQMAGCLVDLSAAGCKGEKVSQWAEDTGCPDLFDDVDFDRPDFDLARERYHQLLLDAGVAEGVSDLSCNPAIKLIEGNRFAQELTPGVDNAVTVETSTDDIE